MSQLKATIPVSAHVTGIDALRAVGAILVYALHLMPAEDHPWTRGWNMLAVNLFFVLSGFWVTKNFAKALATAEPQGNKGPVFWTSLAHRALRLLPIYYLIVLIGWLLDLQHVRANIGWHLLLAGNWRFALWPEWNDRLFHIWYVGAQEQMLIVWMLLMRWVPRRHWVLLAMVILGLTPLLRWITAGQLGGELNYYPMARMDSIVIGALLAIGSSSPKPDGFWGQRFRTGWLWTGHACLLLGYGLSVMFHESMVNYYLSHTLISLGAAAWIDAAIRGRLAFLDAWRIGRWFCWLGTVSYGIYLWHPVVPRLVGFLFARTGYPLGHVLDKLTGGHSLWLLAPSSWGGLFFWWFWTLGLTWLTAKLVEQPWIRLKKYLPRSS